MGTGNWVPELVEAAGGEHLVGETGLHSHWLTWKELQAKNPEVLILCPCDFSLARTQRDLPLLQRHPAWHQLRTVRNGRVYAIDGNAYLNRSGPRLVESAELLVHLIWGEQMGLDVDRDGWCMVGAC